MKRTRELSTCAEVPELPELTLVYLEVTGARAEPLQLALLLEGLPYTYKTLSQAQFLAIQ
jgi:hypothetical protein